jgi:uncharacterized protein (TIGR02145 family)
MSKRILFVIGLFMFSTFCKAQVAINTDGAQPDPSAMLDVKSDTKGALLPRMTLNQMRAIANPANGLAVFCSDDSKFYAYVAGENAWKELLYGPGSIAPWACGESLPDSRDGKTYATVLIGTQCWLAQNLDIGTRINGTTDQADNQEIEKYCYANNEANCTIYGGLYQWDEMMQYSTAEGARGICPPGWHIPSDAEWTVLTDFLGGVSVAGGKLKEAGTAHWIAPNTGATNVSGFTALPAGRRNIAGAFEFITWYSYFRSSSEYSASIAWVRNLSYFYSSVDRSNQYEKTHGFSVRCVKD